MKALALLVFLSPPCLADEIMMKDGQKVPFRSIVDQGQEYEVTTTSGKKATLRKIEIEKIVIDPTEAPLTGATFTKLAGKLKTVNGLSLIDPKRDLACSPTMPCKLETHGPELVCDLRCDTPTWVSVAVKTPVEYDFEMVLERADGVSNFYVSLIGGGGVPFLVTLDDGGKSGVWGQKQTEEPMLKKGDKVTLDIAVRKDSVTVKVNDREVSSWHGKWADLIFPPTHVPQKGKGQPFVGSQKIFGTVPNLWIIHRMTFTMN
jgi:hypothetical protein